MKYVIGLAGLLLIVGAACGEDLTSVPATQPPSPTLTPTATVAPTAVPTVAASRPTATSQGIAEFPSPEPSPTPQPAPTLTPTPTATPKPTPAPTATPTTSPTITPIPTPTPTLTPTPTGTPIPSLEERAAVVLATQPFSGAVHDWAGTEPHITEFFAMPDSPWWVVGDVDAPDTLLTVNIYRANGSRVNILLQAGDTNPVRTPIAETGAFFLDIHNNRPGTWVVAALPPREATQEEMLAICDASRPDEATHWWCGFEEYWTSPVFRVSGDFTIGVSPGVLVLVRRPDGPGLGEFAASADESRLKAFNYTGEIFLRVSFGTTWPWFVGVYE